MDIKQLIWESAQEATDVIKRAEQDPRGFEIALDEMLETTHSDRDMHTFSDIKKQNSKKQQQQNNTQKYQDKDENASGVFDKKTKTLLIVVGMVLFVLLLILIIVALTRCTKTNVKNNNSANHPVIFTYALPPHQQQLKIVQQ